MTPGVAAALVAGRPEVVEQQLQYWPYREAKSNPAGALRLAIEEGWSPPPRWLEAAKKREQAVRAQQRRRREQSRAEQEERVDAAFDAWWEQLSEVQRAGCDERAKSELIGDNAILAQYYQRNPDSLPKALRPLRKRLSGWETAPRQAELGFDSQE